jgi:hypothetical protein
MLCLMYLADVLNVMQVMNFCTAVLVGNGE